jgi:hypothetical protein
MGKFEIGVRHLASHDFFVFEKYFTKSLVIFSLELLRKFVVSGLTPADYGTVAI